MPSPSRTDADSTGRLTRWGLGIVGALVVFMALPAVGWALFTSNSSNTASVSSAADWTPPTVVLTDPGDAIRGTATFSATASDAETGVNNVVIAWAPSGTTSYTNLCTDPTSPYSCTFNTVGQVEDYIDVLATATDNSGYTATSLVEGVLIDNTAPAGSLDAIPSPMSGVVNITATATDSGSGVASVVVQRATAGTTTWTTICTSTTVQYGCRFDSTQVTDGAYDFRAIVTDVAGNSTTTATVRNRVVSNTTVESVSVNDPGTFLKGTVTITANANATIGVASVKIQRQASGTTTWVDLCTDTASPYTCSWDTTTVADGGYSFRAILTDSVGTVTTSAVVGPSLVDNTALRGTDVQATTAAGGSAGKLSAGDTVTVTYSDNVKASTILTGWDGSARSVVVRLRDGVTLGLTTNDDTLDVFTTSAYTTPVNVGSVNLKGNYVKNNKLVPFNATMTLSGNKVTITLGAATASAGQLRAVSSATMVWTPSASATDLAGNKCSSAPVTESGTKDKDF